MDRIKRHRHNEIPIGYEYPHPIKSIITEKGRTTGVQYAGSKGIYDLGIKSELNPNAIIIVFDNEKKIQDKIKYDKKELEFYFPLNYCSAWIIDGQHRVFGFLNTKYEKCAVEDEGIFKLPVVAFKQLEESKQAEIFVDINYNQKKIDPSLFCDLATITKDLKNKITWPSLLVSKLNKIEPLVNKIKISESDKTRSISLSSFSKSKGMETLLKFNKQKNEYNGLLYKYAPFDANLKFEEIKNQEAFKKQLDLLARFFRAVEKNTRTDDENKNPWNNKKDYALLKATGINALLLVLDRIFEKDPQMEKDLDKYLKPLKNINFEREYVASMGGV